MHVAVPDVITHRNTHKTSKLDLLLSEDLLVVNQYRLRDSIINTHGENQRHGKPVGVTRVISIVPKISRNLETTVN
jgi:hypothetical protein